MALVTISGYPCSGKTTRALQIQTAFEERIKDPAYVGPIKTVKLISDETLELSRKAYDGELRLLVHLYVNLNSLVDGRMEKPQRGALFSAIQRNLNSDTIVIVDGLNYIKGFRYQMYCLAREVSARVATVGAPTSRPSTRKLMQDDRYSLPHLRTHAAIGTNSEQKRRVTPTRRGCFPPPVFDPVNAYASSSFDNLIQRYEEPSSMVRWDSPLSTVPWTEDQPPTEEIWQAVTAGVLKPPNAGTSSVSMMTSDLW
jgi:protein KTI12